ncbi:branched-chain amino acid transport system substrate-binding protein [Actinoplanes tereljensis]|uniref:Twin-arginine translocation pathway signal protein n=1 Tax=Paractinoplanes tereljensis TaxID=571912 RepID=A0A919NYS2_9ACTN|nr:ABC transporter substrate-binding protein [Actinoplanes tereljensis]GIF25797.1 twin-arginine translocation pathway signal protein [Actinoplanes tereljensis]
MRALTLTRRSLLGGALAAAAAGCGPVESPLTAGARASTPLNVGVIRSRKGVFAAEGERFEKALRASFIVATNYTSQIGARTIMVTWIDDQSDPDRAAAGAEELHRRGIRLIAGGTTSASALRIAAIAERHRMVFLSNAPDDRLTGFNRYTFRTGRQTYQDLAAARTLIPAGARVVVYGPDNAAAQVLGAVGTVRDPAWIARTKPDVLFVDWPAPTRKLMRGIPDGLPVVGILGARSTWPAYTPSQLGSMQFATGYVDGAARGSLYNVLRNRVWAGRTDTGHVEGFTAGSLMAEALQTAADDPDGMISLLEGLKFGGVKGDLQIRATDHALLQSMYTASLTWTGASGALTAVTTETLTPDRTTPP